MQQLPPESTASILFRDAERISDALTILKPTAKELKKLGVIDRIVPSTETVTNLEEMAENVNQFLVKSIKDLSKSRIKKLLKKRQIKAKNFGLLKGGRHTPRYKAIYRKSAETPVSEGPAEHQDSQPFRHDGNIR